MERVRLNIRRSTLFRDKNIFTLICNHPNALNKSDNIDDSNIELIGLNSGPVNNNFGEWWKECLTDDELNHLNRMEASNKMRLLFSILEECESCNEKVLVFSHSLATLDIIENFLEDNGKWRNRYYFRMDGNTNSAKRQDDIERFLSDDTSRY